MHALFAPAGELLLEKLFSLRQQGTSYFHLYFVFTLAERKNEIQKEDKVPHCRRRATIVS
jgi:hypothetical protein